MPAWLAVGIGGFVGAISRFYLSGWCSEWSEKLYGRVYPVGTLAVNVLGCLLIGLLMTLAEQKRLSIDAQRLLVSGCLGSLTTFSTFGLDTIELFLEGKPGLGVVYVLANVAVGLIAVCIGISVGRLLVQ
ncbi:fluoride efflux transporter CrcB [bacterium]|nr:fluoride efflux transporter CrcB [bacterium]